MATPGKLAPAVQAKRWTRAGFERLGDLGAFEPEERLELIDGEIIQVSPQGSAHATALALTFEALQRRLGERRLVRMQMPLALNDNSLPEPDLAIVLGGIRDYAHHHPADAELVVEVADTTLTYDRERKLALYARGGIPVYWIVNLVDRCVEVHSEPAVGERAGGYRLRRIVAAGEVVALPDGKATIPVNELLP